MAFDAHKNLAYSTVATAPAPAASGTSLVVFAGDGAKFPAASFNATVWPANTQPTTANAEIVRVTVIATDTFTITRAQESTAARTILVGDQIAATVTAKSLTDIENLMGTLTLNAAVIGGGAGAAPTTIAVGTAGQVLAGSAAAPAFLGGATLLKSGTGTSTAAGATVVDSIALSGLTAKDVLLVFTNLETVTQNTAQVGLYSVTDSLVLGVVTPSPLATTAGEWANSTLQQRQGNTNSAVFTTLIQHVDGGGGTGPLAQFVALTTAYTAAWTLGLRHGGVTAGGTFKYTWSVYRLAGQ